MGQGQEGWTSWDLEGYREFVGLFFFSVFFWPHCMACGVLVPPPGIKPAPPAWKLRILTTGLPGKSQGDGLYLRNNRWGLCWPQWLRLHASNAGDAGSIPGQGTKVLHATQCSQKKKKASRHPGRVSGGKGRGLDLYLQGKDVTACTHSGGRVSLTRSQLEK